MQRGLSSVSIAEVVTQCSANGVKSLNVLLADPLKCDFKKKYLADFSFFSLAESCPKKNKKEDCQFYFPHVFVQAVLTGGDVGVRMAACCACLSCLQRWNSHEHSLRLPWTKSVPPCLRMTKTMLHAPFAVSRQQQGAKFAPRTTTGFASTKQSAHFNPYQGRRGNARGFPMKLESRAAPLPTLQSGSSRPTPCGPTTRPSTT